MGYTVSTSGMEGLEQMLGSLGESALGVAKTGLYDGAGVMADSVSQAVRGIATEPFKYASNGAQRKPSPEEKQILENARRGISKFEEHGISVDTSVGIGKGYAAITWNHARSGVRTKYKIGYGRKVSASTSTEGKSSGRSVKPVEVIANAINSGTSFMKKQPFFQKSVRKNKDAVLDMIEASINRKIQEMTK